jgi:DNA-binding HxlR family transcriptional regulator
MPRRPAPQSDAAIVPDGTSETPSRAPRRAGRALQGLPGGRDDDSPLALDRLIHERLRLGIVSALAVNEALTFVELKRLLKTTDGNLSVHARKLEEAGYISCTKEFEGRTPRTEYRLTRAGRLALERYLEHMEALIKSTREGTKA